MALDNPKHERFAQLLAKGASATDAYVQAGYKANDGNAATLKGNQRVKARVAEIQERAAVRAEVTVAGITKKLLEIAEKAEGKDEAPMLGVARASYMDVAKLNGLVIDKSAQANVSLEELLDRIDGATGEPSASSH